MNRKSLIFAFVLLLLVACKGGIGTVAQDKAEVGAISGRVIDSSDGAAIAHANVSTDPPTSSVTADVGGEYVISDVYPGNYTVVASKYGYGSVGVRVAVAAGLTTTADVQLATSTGGNHTVTPIPAVTEPASRLPHGQEGVVNGDLETNDFGTISTWAQTNIELYRWYLVQDISPEGDNARWIERVDLSDEGRGFGLKSTDFQNCDYFCSVSAVQIVPAEANQLYILSAEARIEENDRGNASPSIYLDFLDQNRYRINASTKGGFSNQWQRQIHSARSPMGTQYIRIILYSGNKGMGVVYWDDVELMLGDE